MLARILSTAAASIMLSVAAQAEPSDNLRGTWIFVSSVMEKDGVKTDQFGAGAKGMMILDAEGRFMLTIVGQGLPKFVSNNRATGTPTENQAVVAKSIAMFGTYAYLPSDKTITLKIDLATFPNWNSTEQKRLVIQATGEELQYKTAQASGGGTAIVTWKRAD